MAETLNPCWCKSRITTSSPSLTTNAFPRTIEGLVGHRRALPRNAAARGRRVKLGNIQSPDLGRMQAAMTWTLTLLETAVVELNIVDRASDNTIGRTLKKTRSSDRVAWIPSVGGVSGFA